MVAIAGTGIAGILDRYLINRSRGMYIHRVKEANP